MFPCQINFSGRLESCSRLEPQFAFLVVLAFFSATTSPPRKHCFKEEMYVVSNNQAISQSVSLLQTWPNCPA